MGAEKLPVSPLQEKMEPVVLSDQLAEMMPAVLSSSSISELCKKFFLSRQGMKRRLTKIYAAFGVKSRFDLLAKASQEGLQYRGDKVGGVIHYTEITTHKKRL